MSQQVLVRGGTSTQFNVFRALAMIAMVGGGIVLFQVPKLAPRVAIVGLQAVIMEIVAWRQRRNRLWVTDNGDGFIVQSPWGQDKHQDDDVVGMGFNVIANFVEGASSGVRRQVRLWVNGSDQPISFDVVYTNQADPLGPLLQRIVKLLEQRSEAVLAKGRSLLGDNCQFSLTELSWTQGTLAQYVPVSDISATGLFDGRICLWRTGEEQPFLKLDPVGKNHWLIVSHLEKQLATRRDSTRRTAELGRALFERKTPSAINFLGALVIAAIVLAALCVMMESKWSFGISLLLAAVVTGYLTLKDRQCLFRRYEAGVFHRSHFGRTTTILFDDIESFMYSITRIHVNGGYAGSTLTMRIRPRNGNSIRYRANLNNADRELDEQRDFLAHKLGVGMLQRLRHGERVPWTAHLAFTPQGIEYSSRGYFKREAMRLLTYADFGGWKMDEGDFYLFRKSNPNPVFSEQSSAENFFAGLFVLQQLTAPTEGESNNAITG